MYIRASFLSLFRLHHFTIVNLFDYFPSLLKKYDKNIDKIDFVRVELEVFSFIITFTDFRWCVYIVSLGIVFVDELIRTLLEGKENTSRCM